MMHGKQKENFLPKTLISIFYLTPMLILINRFAPSKNLNVLFLTKNYSLIHNGISTEIPFSEIIDHPPNLLPTSSYNVNNNVQNRLLFHVLFIQISLSVLTSSHYFVNAQLVFQLLVFYFPLDINKTRYRSVCR